MGPIIHTGFVALLLTLAKLIGYDINLEIFLASILGGVLIDGDKVFEIIDKKRREIPDITARWRLLHSIFAFPFGIILGLTVNSSLPFFAVLLHITLDSAVPGIVKNGKNYPSHSPRKWIAIPFVEKSWRTVTGNWPITYPPEFNWIYKKLAPIVGIALLILSSLYWWLYLTKTF